MTLAEIAYEAYRNKSSGRSLFPPFANLPQVIKDAWEEAAFAVQREVRRRTPVNLPPKDRKDPRPDEQGIYTPPSSPPDEQMSKEITKYLKKNDGETWTDRDFVNDPEMTVMLLGKLIDDEQYYLFMTHDEIEMDSYVEDKPSFTVSLIASNNVEETLARGITEIFCKVKGIWKD